MKPLVIRDADGVLRTDDPSAALERLALFEQLTSDLWAEQEALSAELARLRDLGQTKSYHFREKMAQKLSNAGAVQWLERYGIRP